jgi:hypothetical protein
MKEQRQVVVAAVAVAVKEEERKGQMQCAPRLFKQSQLRSPFFPFSFLARARPAQKEKGAFSLHNNTSAAPPTRLSTPRHLTRPRAAAPGSSS